MRLSSPSSTLPVSASESSLSAVDAGEFRLPDFLTRDREDLLPPTPDFFRLMPVGVLFLPTVEVVVFWDPDLGPALPARTVAPAPGPEAPLGVPGPREECLAKALEVVGRLPRPKLDRGPRFGAPLPGPAELSRACRFKIMLAAGVVGADAA